MGQSRYEIRVRGWLSERARSAFTDMDVRAVPPQTIIFGELMEQSDLCDLLAQCSSMGLEVVSLRRLPSTRSDARSPAVDEAATRKWGDAGRPASEGAIPRIADLTERKGT
jgi:hypothetical protein